MQSKDNKQTEKHFTNKVQTRCLLLIMKCYQGKRLDIEKVFAVSQLMYSLSGFIYKCMGRKFTRNKNYIQIVRM